MSSFVTYFTDLVTNYQRARSSRARPGRRPAPRARLQLEPLEARELPAVAMGMNLEHVNDFNPAWMFTDVFQSSRPWISYNYNTATRVMSFDPAGVAVVDEHGWPTQLTQSTNAAGQTLQQRLGTGMFDMIDGHYPAGIYEAQWRGSGTLIWLGDARVRQQFTTPDGLTHALLDVAPTNQGIHMRIDAMSLTDPIRDLHVWMPSYNGQSFSGQTWQPGADFSPFHPLFRERLAPFGTIRFMQPGNTITSDVAHWSDRRPADYARQSTSASVFQNGLSAEYMIELANELHANPWFCMPYLADDEYVRNFAQLVRDTLDPRLTVYIEWSNEVWNSSPRFESNVWVRQQMTLPENVGKTFEDIWGREAKRDFDIWSDVFAGQSQRLTRVAAGFAADSIMTGRMLDAMQGAFDAIAIDGYATFLRAELSQFNANTTADQVIDALRTVSVPRTLMNLRNHQALAERFSASLGRTIHLAAYEGGVLLPGTGQPYEQAFLDAFRSPRVHDIYHDLLRGADAIGLDLFVDYVYTDTSPYGEAGALRWQDQPIADSPKYLALLEAVSGDLFAPEFTIEAVNAIAAEHGPKSATLRLSRTGDLTPVAVGYQLGGNASSDDYRELPAVFTFAAGESFKLVTVTPVDDAQIEGDEKLSIALAPGQGYRVVAAQSGVAVTIQDDDASVYYDLPIVNAGFESGTLSGWTIVPAVGNFSAVLPSATDPLAPAAAHEGRNFVWGAGSTGSRGGQAMVAGVAQRIDLSAHAAGIDGGGAMLTFSGWGAGGGAGRQAAFLEVRYFDAVTGGRQLGNTQVSNRADAIAVWTELVIRSGIPVGTRGVELRALTDRPAGYYANRAGFDDLAAVFVCPDPLKTGAVIPGLTLSAVVQSASGEQSGQSGIGATAAGSQASTALTEVHPVRDAVGLLAANGLEFGGNLQLNAPVPANVQASSALATPSNVLAATAVHARSVASSRASAAARRLRRPPTLLQINEPLSP